MKYLLLVTFLVGCNSCHPTPQPDPPPGPDPVIEDAGVEDVAEDVGHWDELSECGKACTSYRKSGCKEGDPTPRGASCEEICENRLSEDLFPDYPARLKCIAKSTSCTEARNCK